jgi:hypothetical protein
MTDPRSELWSDTTRGPRHPLHMRFKVNALAVLVGLVAVVGAMLEWL